MPVAKELVLQGSDYYYRSSVGGIGQKMKVGVFVQLENRESSRLGMPMPKGVVRVYKKDSAGNAQFVGEDRIDHTPKNETVRLKLGEAFDVTADKKQTDFKRREPTNRASYVFESAYEIVLRNAKKEAATVVVREPVPGDWTMLEETQRHAKVAAGTAEWRVRRSGRGKHDAAIPGAGALLTLSLRPAGPGSGTRARSLRLSTGSSSSMREARRRAGCRPWRPACRRTWRSRVSADTAPSGPPGERIAVTGPSW